MEIIERFRLTIESSKVTLAAVAVGTVSLTGCISLSEQVCEDRPEISETFGMHQPLKEDWAVCDG